MPGMPETVLDVGLNDYAVLGLAGSPARERFAWDSYRRLVERFGTVVMGVEPELFERVRHRVEEQHHVADERLDACDLIRVVETYMTSSRSGPGRSSRRTRRSSCAGRCGRCSTRGTPARRGPCGAARASRTAWARP